ncbi:hypothetical protein Q1695_000811 [Nippostrongylus brasiliensis]|nr:hypothetical protein Q1695_000811 [Nippostrongylus brasiliensis]
MVDIESISPHVLRACAEQRLRQESRNAIAAGHRCPGRSRRIDKDYRYDCSVGEMVFRDVVPEADEIIGKLGFDNVYLLARLLSIYECERSADMKRLRMRDARYAFATVNGIEKAFTFFKIHCDHVFRSLTLHDGSPILLPYSENTEIPINQLNDLNTQGVKYAMTHDWKDVIVKKAVQKVLVVLPDGFRHIQATDEALEVSTYKQFSEIRTSSAEWSHNT